MKLHYYYLQYITIDFLHSLYLIPAFSESVRKKARLFSGPMISVDLIRAGEAKLFFVLFQRRGDKLPEERMRAVRTALELRMELNADKERMVA